MCGDRFPIVTGLVTLLDSMYPEFKMEITFPESIFNVVNLTSFWKAE